MKKNTFIFIIILCVAIIFSLLLFRNNSHKTVKTISVIGECTTSIPQDKIAITLRVKTLDENSTISVRKATDLAQKITKFIEFTEGAKAQTKDFSSFEKTEWNHKTEKYDNLGIQTEIVIEITTDKMETIEKIMSEFVGQPDIYSDNLRMYASTNEIRNAIESCLAEAIKNAHNRASAMAKADNMKVYKLLDASYNTNSKHDFSSRKTYEYKMVTMSAVADNTIDMSGALSNSDKEISVSVNATFEIR